MNEITQPERGLVTDATKPFVHLKVHSAYSLLEGALTITKLVALARADRMPALALTDTNNLFGALEFSAGVAEAGIQPIIGCTLSLSFGNSEAPTSLGEARGPRSEGRIALLAKDAEGYANLMRLSTEAYLTASVSGDAVVSIGTLEAHAKGLIALTGGPDGVIDQALAAGNLDLARVRLGTLQELFGDRLYVELHRHGLPQERAVEPLLLELAYGSSLPVVATNEAYFASPDDFEAHDALICIAEGSYVTV
ncbi:MAG: PHP domain-containing protein, partial [Methyloceanibacter sp.]|nr:PHP domain-containing protein [Methyloceanibacter sp.]